jgi:hypothetical protein
MTLMDLGVIDRISDPQRREAVNFLQSCQDPEDGFFKDPLVDESNRVCGTYGGKAKHSWAHIWNQCDPSYVLEHLGARPLYTLPEQPYPELPDLHDPKWLSSLPWEDPWLAGEQFSNTIKAYLAQPGEGPSGDSNSLVEEIFEKLEQDILDSTTGMPSKGGCDENDTLMAGFFKISFGYAAFHRPLPCANAACHFVLTLQQPEGNFGSKHDMTLNWDAAYLLREFFQLEACKPLRSTIADAGQKLGRGLMEIYLKPDGGFSFYGDTCLTVHNSIQFCDPAPVGDVVGTWMALRCLVYINEWLEANKDDSFL